MIASITHQPSHQLPAGLSMVQEGMESVHGGHGMGASKAMMEKKMVCHPCAARF